jgi:hypothetical protein
MNSFVLVCERPAPACNWAKDRPKTPKGNGLDSRPTPVIRSQRVGRAGASSNRIRLHSSFQARGRIASPTGERLAASKLRARSLRNRSRASRSVASVRVVATCAVVPSLVDEFSYTTVDETLCDKPPPREAFHHENVGTAPLMHLDLPELRAVDSRVCVHNLNCLHERAAHQDIIDFKHR